MGAAEELSDDARVARCRRWSRRRGRLHRVVVAAATGREELGPRSLVSREARLVAAAAREGDAMAALSSDPTGAKRERR